MRSVQMFRPDWALVGVRVTNNPEWPYMILASDTLSQAELEAEIDTMWSPMDPWSDWIPPPPTYSLTAQMPTFVLAYGTTYADALRKIFKSWDPDSAKDPQLPQERHLPKP